MYVVGDVFSLESRSVSAKLSNLNLTIIIIAKQTLPATVSDITKVSQPLSLISHKLTERLTFHKKHMERENQHKRVREGDDEEYQNCSKKIDAEKQDSSKGVDLNDVNDDKDSEKTSCDSSLALDEGVFDFPWLKDGMISKSEDWKLEDTFSSSLYDTSSTNEAGIDEFPAGQCLCQTSEPALLNKPDDHEEKFDDNLRRPQEDDGLGCIWTSLLSEPLQQGGI